MKKTLLIVPINDPEAILISQIAERMELPMIKSKQSHGAKLDEEKGILAKIKKADPERVVIVEMPGPKTEAKIKKLGIELVIIDHHHYTGLNRAHDKKGKQLPSSMEQFLKLFRLGEKRLKSLGFSPKKVKMVGIMDQDYCWGLLKRGYTWRDVRTAFQYWDELMGEIRDMKGEKKKMKEMEQLWKKREEWDGYAIVESNVSYAVRPRLSRIIALDKKKPTPLIVVEKGRGFIYVQESPRAMDLFKKFGGFTYGEHQNWGYNNKGSKKKITLKMVQDNLA